MAKHAPRFLDLVNSVRVNIRECTVQDVKTRQDAGETLQLIDVREDHEWQAAHLPGAVHLGKGIIERDVEERFPETDAELILYCGGGFRSALAADALQKMGYSNVISMDGGFREWKEAGFALESGQK